MTPLEIAAEFPTYFAYTDRNPGQTEFYFRNDSDVDDFCNSLRAHYWGRVLDTSTSEVVRLDGTTSTRVQVTWTAPRPGVPETVDPAPNMPSNWLVTVQTSGGLTLPQVECVSLDDIPAAIRHSVSGRSVEIDKVTVAFRE